MARPDLVRPTLRSPYLAVQQGGQLVVDGDFGVAHVVVGARQSPLFDVASFSSSSFSVLELELETSVCSTGLSSVLPIYIFERQPGVDIRDDIMERSRANRAQYALPCAPWTFWLSNLENHQHAMPIDTVVEASESLAPFNTRNRGWGYSEQRVAEYAAGSAVPGVHASNEFKGIVSSLEMRRSGRCETQAKMQVCWIHLSFTIIHQTAPNRVLRVF
ncbi:hypothetical protein IWZ03DRAFT_363996 [Phyllosticta citriasiana]|uniref:Uncharacterized protein n=1 Tax=Phyllosticta citriasiana TaxID=595635 RepID=A0ABR1KB61_9PEZI